MGVPVTFLSTGTRSDTVANLTTYLSGKSGNWLLIPWDEIKESIGATTQTPTTLEDWLAAIVYQALDKAIADTNSSNQKITAGRRFELFLNGRGINSNFEANTDLMAYQLAIVLYAPDTTPTRPSADQL